MTSHQPHGPYNVLGVGVSTVLALEVHRQLEAAGRRGVLFLVHGDVGTVARWAGTVRPFGGASAAPDREAQRGAETVAQLLEAVHAHDSDVGRPFEGSVHVVRTSVDDHQSLDENDPHVEVWTYNEHCLDNSVFARFINANIAYSQVAGQQDLRISIKKAPLL
ncbi:hypothetical protein ONE63_006684 [Megalurothrips usitatus]|uniref:Fatty acid synthase-like n=1 Tax=Megalurothrips usitatus TaxID=439358 RepID=A0AAV7XY49_9NEOP|nr:hypothetical protein ONE63_006684 [Megalurothrips usitatus]